MVKRKNEKLVEASKKTKSLPIVEAKETIFDEYYPLGISYVKTANGSEKYAKNQHGDEMYFKNEKGEPVFAQKLVNNKMEIFFPTNRNGDFWVERFNGLPFYPVDVKGNPIFPISFDEQVYAVDKTGVQTYPQTFHSQIYAQKQDGHEFAALDQFNLEYYATKIDNQGIFEYYPKNKDGVPTPLTRNGKILYAKNITLDRPLYSKDNEDNEIYFSDGGGDEHYGRDSKGKEYYRKLKNGEEQLAVQGLTTLYAKDEEQNEYYPQNEKNREVYRLESDVLDGTRMEIPAKTKEDKYFYAKDENGDEFYPRKYLG